MLNEVAIWKQQEDLSSKSPRMTILCQICAFRSVLSDRHWRNSAGKEAESFSLSKPHGLMEGHAVKEAEPRWRIGCGDRTERKHELVGFQAKGGSWPTKRGVTRVTVCPGTISKGPVAG